ncbi:hypothetical protein SPAB_02208 [Salmonella enterica subsp. enterica serovar Paratyphi B str. SPB7]|uniref:Uncharacterized protein n=1 Tax=Salmonella paratyphi B (strain ATCC BAA-1250 / SPB7) TaxID=1016998 RepID=A0A6C6Z331_SALPB|nr:hypothetical protein SPAB_02208 [Salmonella enterica subsp. enterica serovar Paratyphi B str. SPB7]
MIVKYIFTLKVNNKYSKFSFLKKIYLYLSDFVQIPEPN